MSAALPRRGPPHPVTSREPRRSVVGGIDCVLVPLSGKHGIGKDALVRAADWCWVSRLFGTKWNLSTSKKDPTGRIVCATAQATRAAGMIGFHMGGIGHPQVLLSRLIAAADRGDRVFSKNKNPLDLRFDNLEAISNDTIAAFMAHLHAPEREAMIEVG